MFAYYLRTYVPIPNSGNRECGDQTLYDRRMLNVVVIGKQASNWIERLRSARPDDRFDIDGDWNDPSVVNAAVISVPNAKPLLRYPSLGFIQSLWMGVDALLSDPELGPHTALARMVDPGMPVSMAETVAAHVLWAHRHGDVYQRNQRNRVWEERHQPLAPQRTVTMLGLGELGGRSAQTLIQLGFTVVGWSRSATPVDGVHVTANLEVALSAGEIVVNLLPLTDATRGVLNVNAFRAMPVDGVLINVGRGAHVVDADLLDALDASHIRHAILDVFAEEPLPAEHRYWIHPHVTVTPHVAADSMPATCIPVVAENLRRFAAGEPLNHLVDRTRGY